MEDVPLPGTRLHLEHCVQTWNPVYAGNISAIEKVQDRFTRLLPQSALMTPDSVNSSLCEQRVGLEDTRKTPLRRSQNNLRKHSFAVRKYSFVVLSWELFKQTWTNYELVTGLRTVNEEQRLATLLSCNTEDSCSTTSTF